MINKSLKYETELMIITMEECGELIEACSKAIRCENYKDERLTEEVGDVLFLIDLMIDRGLVTSAEIWQKPPEFYENKLSISLEKI